MFRALIFAVSLALFSSAASATDLGVRGHLFPLAEEDLFATLKQRLTELKSSGELDRFHVEAQQRVRASIERPPPVAGIARTEAPRRWHYDPTLILKSDIVAPSGKVIARAGERFNPLDHVPMRRVLLFFDGDDPEQVAWAQEQVGLHGEQAKPILVSGPVLELSRAWRTRVFFDQHGTLTGRLGIVRTPAIARREDRLLRVEEVLP